MVRNKPDLSNPQRILMVLVGITRPQAVCHNKIHVRIENKKKAVF